MDIHSGFWLIDDECTTPMAGDTGFVYISSSGRLSTENNHLVFLYPPYSEVNGWDDTPEEISGTQIIECKLDVLESYPFSDEKTNYLVSRWVIPKNATKYQASIIAVTPFLQFCKDYSGADKFGFFYMDQEMIWKRSKKNYKKNLKMALLTYLVVCQNNSFPP